MTGMRRLIGCLCLLARSSPAARRCAPRPRPRHGIGGSNELAARECLAARRARGGGVGAQGWQASLDWRQRGESSEVHLAGPFGVGALVLKMTPAGLSLNGAPPSDAVVAQLQERLGFELPIDNLRYLVAGHSRSEQRPSNSRATSRIVRAS